MHSNNSYSRQKKLKSRKVLESLFSAGKSFSEFPLKLFYTLEPSSPENADQQAKIKAAVGVSARNFKKAVHRNRIKRLLRETYRTQNQFLYQTATSGKKNIAVFFLYIGKELPDYAMLQLAMSKILKKLSDKINNVSS